MLAVGVDPLTLATDLLTVVAFDAPAYDDLFGDLVASNDEGSVISSTEQSGATSIGIPLTAANVDRFAHHEPMQAAGAEALLLTWQHRGQLLD